LNLQQFESRTSQKRFHFGGRRKMAD
jgi:hypothetical protein